MLSPAAQTEGFTLVELLLAVLLVALLATIAWPTWNGYQADAVVAVLRSNVQSMALFQEIIEFDMAATPLILRTVSK